MSLRPAANNSSSLSLATISDESTQHFKSVESLKEFQPLRRGKWSTDEQNYAELLIQYFLAGVVPECADGTTLRAFLSAKLHCAPMRITKKFAGATLGKSIFYRTGHLEENELLRLRRLETHFVRSEEALSAEAVFFAMRSTQHQQQQQQQQDAQQQRRSEDAVLPTVISKFNRTASTSSHIGDEPTVKPSAITLNKLGSFSGDDDAARGDKTFPVARQHSNSSTSGETVGGHKSNNCDDDGAVAARAKAAANAALDDREENAPASSTWAARVAERAAIVTAARRDAELRAARRKLSSSATELSQNDGSRASPPRQQQQQPQQQQEEPAPHLLAPIEERGTKRQRAGVPLQMAEEAPSSDEPELYSELYGWVPRNLGVTATTDEISRHLGLRGVTGGGDQGRADGEEKCRKSDHGEEEKSIDEEGEGDDEGYGEQEGSESKENEEFRQYSLLKSLLPSTPGNYRERSAAPDADLRDSPLAVVNTHIKTSTRNSLDLPSGASPFLGLSYRKLLVAATSGPVDQDAKS